VPVGETRRILGDNAADLYGLDRDELTPIVERIRPTLEEVHGAGVGG
jgi:hypothetical protein